MPPVVTVPRSLKFTFGAIVVGGATVEYQIDGQYSHEEEYPSGTFTFSAVVLGTTDAEFATNTTAFEAAFRKPQQRFLVELGVEILLDWNPADGINLALTTAAQARQVEDPRNSARAQFYSVTVTATLPADNPGDAGLQSKSTTVRTLRTGGREFTLNGLYTALTTNSASAQHAASFGALATATKTALGGTWDDGVVVTDESFRNKTLRFSQSFKEIVFNQAEGVLDHPAITDHELVISRTTTKTEQSIPGTEQPIELVAVWSSDVKLAVTTNLKLLYEGTIEPYMINEARRVTAASSIALLSRKPDFNKSNRITATLRLLAYTGSKFITSLQTTTDRELRGIEFIEVYSDKPHDCYTTQVPGKLLRIQRTAVVSFGGAAAIPLVAAGKSPIKRVVPAGIGGAAGAGLSGLSGLATGIFGFAKPGDALFTIKPAASGALEGGASRSAGKKGGKAAPGGGGVKQGAQAPGAIPGLSEAQGGQFIPFSRDVTHRPIRIGILPYEVTLTEAVEDVVSRYVTTPVKRPTTGGKRGSVESTVVRGS